MTNVEIRCRCAAASELGTAITQSPSVTVKGSEACSEVSGDLGVGADILLEKHALRSTTLATGPWAGAVRPSARSRAPSCTRGFLCRSRLCIVSAGSCQGAVAVRLHFSVEYLSCYSLHVRSHASQFGWLVGGCRCLRALSHIGSCTHVQCASYSCNGPFHRGIPNSGGHLQKTSRAVSVSVCRVHLEQVP